MATKTAAKSDRRDAAPAKKASAKKTVGAKTPEKRALGTKAPAKRTSAKRLPAKKAAAKSASAKSGGSKAAVKSEGGRKYSPDASKNVERELREMHEGKLTIGKSGKKVTNPKQAIAIGLSEARRAGKKAPPNPNDLRKK